MALAMIAPSYAIPSIFHWSRIRSGQRPPKLFQSIYELREAIRPFPLACRADEDELRHAIHIEGDHDDDPAGSDTGGNCPAM
jgi:hypothetical protein